MWHRTGRPLTALASALAVGIALSGCAAATATTGSTSASGASSTASSAAASARPSAHFNGPFGPDAACAAALKAEQTLQERQNKDANNQAAIDQDLTNFANALNAAAGHESDPAKAKAMTALANDYLALVQSQSGAVALPSMSTVQNDGTAFQKACSNS
jgi:hypothetical protein